MENWRRLTKFLSLTALTWICCASQFSPDAPVVDFRVPFFGDDGRRIWELSGARGVYVSESEVQVEGLKLEVFDPDDPAKIQTTIESTSATIDPRARIARGPDYLLISQPEGGFSVVGRQWTWDGNSRSVAIGDDARVTFHQPMGDVLVWE